MSDFPLRSVPGGFSPRIILVAISTGGPRALFTFLDALPRSVACPVLVTQHMPAAFTRELPGHVTRRTGWAAVEADDGMPIAPDTVHVARGGHHLVVERGPGVGVLWLGDTPPESHCRPAADIMFRTAANVYGGGCLAVVLTGLGRDGHAGARAIVSTGGVVVAQDKATSVIWGMPGAVAMDGLCSAVLPPDALGAWVGAMCASSGS